jgi:carbon-monoxide dehydrogenase medium subunit
MFAYARPESLADALGILAGDRDARPLMGGTDLLVAIRKKGVRPTTVVDLKRVPELASAIDEHDGMLRVAASTPLTTVAADDRIRRWFPALVEAADVVGSIQIRNRATLAGNLCNASPAADTAPPLITHGARVEVTGPAGRRSLSVAEFMTGPGRTVLAEGEIVTAVDLSIPGGPEGSAFGRMTRRRGVDLATVNVACVIGADGVTRMAFGAVGPRPLAAVDESGTLADETAGEEATDAALRRMTAEATPISNVRASREYREAMLLVLARRAVTEARRRLMERRRGG